MVRASIGFHHLIVSIYRSCYRGQYLRGARVFELASRVDDSKSRVDATPQALEGKGENTENKGETIKNI